MIALWRGLHWRAGLVLAALVTLLAFGVGGASACQGSHDGAVANVSASVADDLRVARLNRADPVSVVQAGHVARAHEPSVISDPSFDPRDREGGPHGAHQCCCGHGPGAAMRVSGPELAVPSPMRAARLEWQGRTGSGIDPNGLKRPPRTPDIG